MSSLFVISTGEGEDDILVINPLQVGHVKHAAPSSPFKSVVVMASGWPADAREPIGVVLQLWTKAHYDPHGSPGYWRALPPAEKSVTPHPTNPGVEIIGGPVPWRIERVAVKGE